MQIDIEVRLLMLLLLLQPPPPPLQLIYICSAPLIYCHQFRLLFGHLSGHFCALDCLLSSEALEGRSKPADA